MNKKLCFVIGPMANMPRLNRLVREIIKPVVKEFGYRVETPDQPDMGKIMDQVIATLDQAELVIADLTGNNPNVCYELGLRHCLGRASIVVREKTGEAAQDKPPFDIAAYRHAFFNFNRVEAAKKALRSMVKKTTDDVETNQPISNPVTDYYAAPLTETSPAAGLALGYFRNFVEPALQKIRDETRPILIGEQEIVGPLRKKVKLEIIIPQTLAQARLDYIGSNLVKKGLLKDAEFKRKPDEQRRFTLYAWPDTQNGCRLVDIPTTMNVMERAIQRRLKQSEPIYNKEWKIIEAQEIARFHSALNRELAQLIRNQAGLKGRVQIRPWPFSRSR